MHDSASGKGLLSVRSTPLPRLLFPALLITVLLAGAGVSNAGELPAPGSEAIRKPDSTSPPAGQNEPAPAETLNEQIISIEHDVDSVHKTLEGDILYLTTRLDNFFGTEKADNKRPTGYQLRWSNFVREEFGGPLKFGTSLRANVVLSRINDRLRLSLSGDNKQAPAAPGLPEEPGNPGFDRLTQKAKLVNAELRYGLLQSPSTDVFLGAGLRLVVPPEAFVRNRYEYVYHLSDVLLAKAGETFFVNSATGAGETTEAGLERSLGRHTLLSWANSGTLSQEFKGVEWGSELSLTQELSPQQAITVAGGVFGNTSVDDAISTYRILARYRRNFLRSWLFYELVPEIFWPRAGDGTFPTKYAITFLVEVVLQGESSGMAKKQ